jgi:hypothetical protein
LLSFLELFRYWAKELLYAFFDITYKSTYTLQTPITLENIYVSEIGIKVYLNKIKFGEQRDNNLDYHLHLESTMLKMYATLLIQMLTNHDYTLTSERQSMKMIENDLNRLEIDSELKCILYECLHAQDKTLKREEDRYHFEIARQITKDQHISGGGTEADFLEQERFKELMNIAKTQEEEDQAYQTRKQRKPDNPKPNARDFELEN